MFDNHSKNNLLTDNQDFHLQSAFKSTLKMQKNTNKRFFEVEIPQLIPSM